MKFIKYKKGFTLIELIVVMAVIGILVLLAMPKFMGHTKEAKYTKLISNTKQLENASERYYMDNQDWPRLTDVPYSADQITAFAQKIHDSTGKVVTLDATGNYYDVDYATLSKYIHVPDDKTSYIIQNPVGNIYALENLTKSAEMRLTAVKVTGLILDNTDISISTGATQTLMTIIQPADATNKTVTWSSSNTAVATVNNTGVVTSISSGSTIITGTTQDGNFTSNCTITVQAPFTTETLTYTGNYQTWTVPKTGTYKLETYGAEGGGTGSAGTSGGKGGYAFGQVALTKGSNLYIYVGSKPTAVNLAGWNGGGAGISGISYGGGGATDIRTSTLLTSRIIVGAGGGGQGQYIGVNAGNGGGLSGDYGNGGSSCGEGGTQVAGGVGRFPSDGYGVMAGKSGSLGIGGNGVFSAWTVNYNAYSSAGGGGGYYGGASGGTGGHGGGGNGGGGSSYIGSLQNAGTTAGLNTGSGKAIITYIGQ